MAIDHFRGNVGAYNPSRSFITEIHRLIVNIWLFLFKKIMLM